MSDVHNIPEGEERPETIFAAVGHALTCWELMEAELATLYTILVGKPRLIAELAAYGKKFGTFDVRTQAIIEQRNKYAVSHPDQNVECAIGKLIEEAKLLGIVRHRIAHGILFPMSSYDPDNSDQNGFVWPTIRYWLGAPFYSMEKLKTKFVGLNAAQINAQAVQFIAMRDRITQLNDQLSPELSADPLANR